MLRAGIAARRRTFEPLEAACRLPRGYVLSESVSADDVVAACRLPLRFAAIGRSYGVLVRARRGGVGLSFGACLGGRRCSSLAAAAALRALGGAPTACWFGRGAVVWGCLLGPALADGVEAACRLPLRFAAIGRSYGVLVRARRGGVGLSFGACLGGWRCSSLAAAAALRALGGAPTACWFGRGAVVWGCLLGPASAGGVEAACRLPLRFAAIGRSYGVLVRASLARVG